MGGTSSSMSLPVHAGRTGELEKQKSVADDDYIHVLAGRNSSTLGERAQKLALARAPEDLSVEKLLAWQSSLLEDPKNRYE